MKETLALIFGGKSCEHEISLISAKNIHASLDKNKYDVILIGIDKSGGWHICDESVWEDSQDLPSLSKEKAERYPAVAVIPDTKTRGFISLGDSKQIVSVDIAFPITHGPFGEDGTLQGLLRMAGIPYVGADLLSSSICMDKSVSKKLLEANSIPVLPFMEFRNSEEVSRKRIESHLKLPLFVKPSNLGSSVGISKVKSWEELEEAVKNAFKFDSKIIIEQGAEVREIECAVIGNSYPESSVPGEIIPINHEFYSYKAKYEDPNGADLIIPAKLYPDQVDVAKRLAISAYKILNVSGFARVDLFLCRGNFFVNEVNTLPGFTSISMFPKLWEYSGIKYNELLDKLIKLAKEKHKLDFALFLDL
ncbi:MAG: D-alanine--D-alanine ligase [Candidatus Coatesbacteria bacterium]|nr:D-alanine--D-alanine ligase [Candidatus Coatesbacteria bacterium]